MKQTWEAFDASRMGLMRSLSRRFHPSRDAFYAWFDQQLSDTTLDWTDIGLVSMVDYQVLRRRYPRQFRFHGLDLSASIAEDARRYLVRVEDTVSVGDLENPTLGQTYPASTDLLSLRHVLNHCQALATPLENAATLLRPGGKVFITLHRPCETQTTTRVLARDLPGVEYHTVFSLEEFLTVFTTHFALESWWEIPQGYDVRKKANQVFIGIKPGMPMRRMGRTRLPDPLARWRFRLRAWSASRCPWRWKENI